MEDRRPTVEAPAIAINHLPGEPVTAAALAPGAINRRLTSEAVPPVLATTGRLTPVACISSSRSAVPSRALLPPAAPRDALRLATSSAREVITTKTRQPTVDVPVMVLTAPRTPDEEVPMVIEVAVPTPRSMELGFHA